MLKHSKNNNPKLILEGAAGRCIPVFIDPFCLLYFEGSVDQVQDQ